MGKTLVTGGTGFIGSHVVRQLSERGEDVVVLTRGKASSHVNLTGLKFEERNGDLLDAGAVSRALEGCSKVFHIAGHIGTAKSESARVFDSNWVSTQNVFRACRDKGVDKIVYLASIFALGGGEQTPFTENDSYNLEGSGIDYFEAKRKAELLAYAEVEQGLPIVFVYPCYCFGPGDVYVSSGRPVLGMVNGEIPAYVMGGINAMDVRDAAAGLILGMDKGRVGAKYLIGGENLTWPQFFAKLEMITGLSGPKIALNRKLASTAGALLEKITPKPLIDRASAEIMGRYWFYDDTLARTELGYHSRHIDEALRDGIRWFAQHGLVHNRRLWKLPSYLRS